MSDLPNSTRRRTGRAAPHPAPEDIRRARHQAGLTQAQAAALIFATKRAWEGWEQGERRMHPGLWRYFLERSGQAGKEGS